MKKRYVAGFMFIALLILYIFQIHNAFATIVFHADFFKKKGTIVIDAGHGGEDGGSTGIGEVLEKNLNLSIALKLRDKFEENFFNVVMIRDGDYAVGDPSLETVSKRKSSDMRNRLKMIRESGDSIFISIHQNHFEQSKYNGAQIFYSPNNEKSSHLAESIRVSIVESLQPDNKRENKESGKNIYLLYNCDVPAVLVECGFISNESDAANLSTDEYQTKMAEAIYKGTVEYIKEMS